VFFPSLLGGVTLPPPTVVLSAALAGSPKGPWFVQTNMSAKIQFPTPQH